MRSARERVSAAEGAFFFFARTTGESACVRGRCGDGVSVDTGFCFSHFKTGGDFFFEKNCQNENKMTVDERRQNGIVASLV